jgi:hypothetical protein
MSQGGGTRGGWLRFVFSLSGTLLGIPRAIIEIEIKIEIEEQKAGRTHQKSFAACFARSCFHFGRA